MSTVPNGVTVAIATYNRCNELTVTLQSLHGLYRADTLPFEVLVVGNCCTDATGDVVARFASEFDGPVRYVHEQQPGLSHARNRAVAEASFDVIAFLDDDVSVEPQWLQALSRSYGSEEHAAVGGRAALIYPTARPRWLSDRFEGLLTKMDYGPVARDAAADELFGVNLSIRKAWITSVGGFRTDLGRVKSCLLGSEESDLLQHIAEAGGTLRYDPGMAVGHRVPLDRLRRQWFWSRMYWGHIGEMRLAAGGTLTALAFARAVVRALRAAAGALLALVGRGPGSSGFFDAMTTLAARWGDVVGLASRWRNPIASSESRAFTSTARELL